MYNHQAYHKHYRTVRRLEGLCKCGRKLVPGKTYCRKCHKRALSKAKTKLLRNRARGLCNRCGVRPPLPGFVTCGECRSYGQDRHRKLRAEVIAAYGGVCICCGETELVFLCIDHVHNDGAAHRKKVGVNIYTWLKKNNWPKGFQVLCHNCNHAKHVLGECPHQKKKLGRKGVKRI